jgi:hypothetical protein
MKNKTTILDAVNKSAYESLTLHICAECNSTECIIVFDRHFVYHVMCRHCGSEQYQFVNKGEQLTGELEKIVIDGDGK